MTKCRRPFAGEFPPPLVWIFALLRAIDPRQLRNELCFSRHDFNLNFSAKKYPGEIPFSPLCLSIFFCFYRKRCEMTTAHRASQFDYKSSTRQSVEMEFFTRHASGISSALPACDLSALCLYLSTARFYTTDVVKNRDATAADIHRGFLSFCICVTYTPTHDRPPPR